MHSASDMTHAVFAVVICAQLALRETGLCVRLAANADPWDKLSYIPQLLSLARSASQYTRNNHRVPHFPACSWTDVSTVLCVHHIRSVLAMYFKQSV